MAQISGTITQAGQSLNGTVRASGRGIASVDINNDGYLVVTYTDGEVWTSDEVIIGNGIESIELTSTSGAVKTYTITFTDGTTTTFNVTDGEVTNASLALITGDLTDLETTDKTDIVSAINEVNGKAEDANEHVGDLSDLDTEDKTSAVDAINEVLGKIPVMTKEVTGNPIVVDDALNADVVSLGVDLEPVQDLHGYDKPWAGGAGKNKVDIASGSITATTNLLSKEVSAGTYTFSAYGKRDDNGSWRVLIADQSDVGIAAGNEVSGSSLAQSRVTFTLTETATIRLKLQFLNSYDTLRYERLQLELGSTATTYAPYSNICPITGHDSVTITDTDGTSTNTTTVALPSTVYGGTVGVTSGTGTSTMANIASYNGETINEPWLSSMDEYSPGATPTTGAQVVYTLATPTDLTTTPTDITLYNGDNTVSADGDMDMVYVRDIVKVIEKLEG